MKYIIRNRQFLEKLEDNDLAPYAARSAEWSNTREHPEDEHPYRTAFQRDRDRIIHSRAFRRLKHKRQVFLTHYGDHYRTRLTHTLEVSQLSRTMARAMGLNEDLVEAIALGHDLGHTPFGHIGEVVLHRIMAGRDDLDGLLHFGDLGGYKHNYQSVRVVDRLEQKYQWDGLNLTAAVREGILKHTRLRRDVLNFPDFYRQGLNYELDHAVTLEGQVVAVCDEIAQRTHDLEDGIRAGYVELGQVRSVRLVQQIEHVTGLDELAQTNPFLYRNRLIHALIDTLVTDVIDASLARIEQFETEKNRQSFFDTLIVWFSDRMDPLQDELDKFITKEIIMAASRDRSDDEAIRIIRELFKVFYRHPTLLPEYRLKHCLQQDEFAYFSHRLDEKEQKKIDRLLRERPAFIRAVCDHIAGMTDNFAEQEMKRLIIEPEKEEELLSEFKRSELI